MPILNKIQVNDIIFSLFSLLESGKMEPIYDYVEGQFDFLDAYYGIKNLLDKSRCLDI